MSTLAIDTRKLLKALRGTRKSAKARAIAGDETRGRPARLVARLRKATRPVMRKALRRRRPRNGTISRGR